MIEKLTIAVGDKKIELTLEEARALQQELNEALGDNRPVQTYPVFPNVPYYGPIAAPVPDWPLRPIVTCGNMRPQTSGFIHVTN